MNKDKGGPAFPFEYHNQTNSYQEGFFGLGKIAPGAGQQFAGMSLRDYFAAKAMQALITASCTEENAIFTVFNRIKTEIEMEDWIAYSAYAVADAMLKEKRK